ncbi:type 1 fimbrial protein [Shigella flexneri]|nr:type 1 fimbrial protein [Shigella flexneri]
MSVKSKIAVATLMALCSASASVMAATDVNKGQVTFSGEVVETACSLAAGQDGTDVKVDFGQLSATYLNNDGEATVPFVLKLENCSLGTDPDRKTVAIAFDSNTKDTTNVLMSTTGSAGGVGIGIHGYKLGEITDLSGIVDGNNTLNFTAIAKKMDGESVTPGDFSAISTFQISYK